MLLLIAFAFFSAAVLLELFFLDIVDETGREVLAVATELEAPDARLVAVEFAIAELAELQFKDISKGAAEIRAVYIVVLGGGRVVELLAHRTEELDLAFARLVVSSDRKHQLLFTQNARAVAKISFDELLPLRLATPSVYHEVEALGRHDVARVDQPVQDLGLSVEDFDVIGQVHFLVWLRGATYLTARSRECGRCTPCSCRRSSRGP